MQDIGILVLKQFFFIAKERNLVKLNYLIDPQSLNKPIESVPKQLLQTNHQRGERERTETL